jgi:hypothetical protein
MEGTYLIVDSPDKEYWGKISIFDWRELFCMLRMRDFEDNTILKRLEDNKLFRIISEPSVRRGSNICLVMVSVS